jgi:hypothetical protein
MKIELKLHIKWHRRIHPTEMQVTIEKTEVLPTFYAKLSCVFAITRNNLSKLKFQKVSPLKR